MKDILKTMAKTDELLEKLSFDNLRDKDPYQSPFGYTSTDGCYWGGPLEYYQGHVLDFCCCGLPEDNLKYIHDGLELIAARFAIVTAQSLMETPFGKYNKQMNAWRADVIKFFGSEQSKDFFFYWADREGFTEHGHGMPGWLTDKGKIAVADIAAILELVEMKVV